MKIAIAFALFAACVAASTAAPAPQAVNWGQVQAKVNEIRQLVGNAVNQIKDIANRDNASVGASIGRQLDAAAAKALAVLDQANNAIDGQSLTVPQAEQLFNELKNILAGVQSDLQDELAELSTGAAGQIRDLFYAAYAQAEAKAQEVYALLRSTAIVAVNWQQVQAKVNEIRQLVGGAVNQIKDIATRDNPTVGASIGRQLDAAAAKALAVLDQANNAIDGQSLTVGQAEQLFTELKNILAGVQSDLQDELAELSSAAAGQIRDLFYSAYAQAEAKAQEVYALLRATTTVAVNWQQVQAKVNEIRQLVGGAVNQIKDIATRDNPTVGASIGRQLDAAAAKALAVLDQANNAIDGQSLTVGQAEQLFTELKNILAGVQSDLQDELAELSSGAAGQIRDLFYSAYAQAEAKAQEVYALLRATAIAAVNWPQVQAKVNEIRQLVGNAVNQIKDIATRDNPTVGASIGRQLDAAAAKALAVLDQANNAIDGQNLTVPQAEQLFNELKNILAGVQSDLQDELAELSTGAAGQIRDLFYAAYAQAEAKAQEVYALLRQ